jgi:hypothetical protein
VETAIFFHPAMVLIVVLVEVVLEPPVHQYGLVQQARQIMPLLLVEAVLDLVLQ